MAVLNSLLVIGFTFAAFLRAPLASGSGSSSGSDITVPGVAFHSEVVESPVPYVVGLRTTSTDSNYCTGVLIADQYVLTSNLCHPAIKTPGNISQWAKIDDLNRATRTNGEQVRVSKWFSHPQYSPQDGSYDFMLVKLAASSSITSVQLWIADHSNLPKTETPLKVYGWNQGGPINASSQPEVKNYMWAAEMNILDSMQCGKDAQLSETEFCALGDSNLDACRVNEGSPIIQKIVDRDTVVGFVSNRSGCKQTGVATVFSDVGLGYRWIKQKKHDFLIGYSHRTHFRVSFRYASCDVFLFHSCATIIYDG